MTSDDKIFHYTSIESLAMILSSRKIRFSRLDCLDDLLEAQTHSGIEFGKFFFASCWTQVAEESIPQWSMYGNKMRGVRIELPKYPFRRITIEPKQHSSWLETCEKPIYGPLSIDECDNETYFIQPNFFDDFFNGSVEYVKDVGARYIEAIERTGDKITIKEPNKLPRIKPEHWAFQTEYRFHLWVLPKPHQSDNNQQNPGIQMIQAFKDGVDPGINFLDVPLEPLIFNDLIIRTGPLCTPGNRICIEALLAKHAPSAKLETSHFEGMIKGS